MPLGMLWYGPLFGKRWMKLMGFSEKSMNDAKKNMATTYGAQLGASFLQAFVLSLLIFSSRITEFSQIIVLGFWVWLGFMATVILTKQLFDTRPFTPQLYLIDIGYQLVVVSSMAIIISLFV